ncbi:MBL fold metallo-hydrolase RNA specificity domain-containing protein [Actinophytocola sp.]|uniref:MBL fold metallo-hydrolase RNA specificity domain-containing protein n=1 Tax=Actinophytocola sp. TaxID=1872138 RepID=UPI00389B09A1
MSPDPGVRARPGPGDRTRPLLGAPRHRRADRRSRPRRQHYLRAVPRAERRSAADLRQASTPVQGTRRQIASLRSGVVIATSRMLAAGPAVAWAEALLPDPAAGVMLVGYQSENSPGAKLLDLAESGGEFELPGSGGFPVRVPVNARVGRYGLGAHATADELVSISAEVAANAVMLVHGTPTGQAILADRLRKRGQRVVSSDEWTSAG